MIMILHAMLNASSGLLWRAIPEYSTLESTSTALITYVYLLQAAAVLWVRPSPWCSSTERLTSHESPDRSCLRPAPSPASRGSDDQRLWMVMSLYPPAAIRGTD
jgi:hypothetical protein